MKGLKFKSSNSIKTKRIILSVVTIIELIALLLTMTFAWFEGLTSLEIKGENLSTAGGLKSKFIVGEGPAYMNTAELNEFFHKQSFDKLSPVSSMDGDNFYAITSSTGEIPASQKEYLAAVNNKTAKFRKLSDEEKLSSIVYFQFELAADSSDTDFWFKNQPTIKIGDTTLNSENNPFRISIDDGTGAASSTANNYLFTTCTQWPGGNRANMKAVKSIDANGYATLNSSSELITNFVNSCVFGEEINNDGEYKLFTVPKGQSKIITVAIWIEAFDPAYNENIIRPGATVDINIEFCSSWDVVDKMVFRDFTSDQWVDTVDEDQINKPMKFGIANLGSSSNYYYPFEYDADNKQWTADIPRAVQKIKFIWQGVNDTSHEDAVWQSDTERGNKKVFTAFGSSAGIWYDGDVDHITFSDYTSEHWVNNYNPKMRAQITYDNNIMEYSMTDAPTKDSAGKNVWGMFIPKAVDKVIFNRCNRSDETEAFNTWDGKERNGHTKYYAIDGGTVEVVQGTAIYLSMPLSLYNKNYNFNDSSNPAITFTSTNNITAVESARNSGALQNMPKSNYVTSGQHCDTWPGTNGEMKELKRTTSNIYFVYYLDYKLTDGTYLTFWSKTHVNSNGGFNNIDNNVSMLPAVQYKEGYNQFAISGFTQFTNSEFGNSCYVVSSYQTAKYSGSDGNVTKPGKEQKGQWGAPDLPKGTYQTYFVQTLDNANSKVTATFEYYGVEHTVEFTQNSSDTRKWWSATGAIPDDVTVITFTDSAGNKWTSATSGTRSKATNYYYATTSSTGLWSANIEPPEGYKTYFVPPSGNTASTVTAIYTYKGVEFSTTLTKGTNGYWATQSIPNEATSINFTDGTNTWKTGTGRTSTNCYYMASSNTAGEWGKPVVYKTIYLKPDSNLWDQAGAWFWAHAWNDDESVLADVKMTAVSGQSGLYSVEIPEEATNILFVRMNPAYTDVSYTGKWDQTVDLKIPSDSNTFTITSWDNGTWDEVEEPEPDPDPEPEEGVLYLKPNSNWTQSNARFAAYFFNNSTNKNTWVSMTANGDGTYKVTIPDGTWPNVIFCRMNPSTTANNWDKGVKWNQTSDLTIPTDGKNLYTVKDGTWDKGGGSWSTK